MAWAKLVLASVLAAGSAALATAGVVWAAPRVMPPDSGAVPGLRIGGVTLAAGENIAGHLDARARAIEGRRVRVEISPGTSVTRTLGELGVRVEREQTRRRAEAIGRSGVLAVKIDELGRARRGEIDVPLRVRVDADTLAGVILPLKEQTDSAARPARFDLDTGAIVAHAPGRHLDFDDTIGALERVALAGEGERELRAPQREIAPRVDAALLATVRLDAVLARFETHFALDPNRGRNIEVAASRLDGMVLAPDEIVSFNETVGARTEKNGFRPAPEIYKGEMVTGIGGGTCQVSSTFHAAALNAGFDVVERYPHSRPLGYIALGLDSTVSWPTVDLKLKNPFPFPVVVDTRVERGKLTVELLGREKPATVHLRSDTLAVIPFKRKVTESNWLEPGKIVKKQKGIRGYAIKKTRLIRLSDGSERVETTVDHYPPTPEHLVVAPGTAEDDLPPLPDGAAGSNGSEGSPDEREAAGPFAASPPSG